MLLQLWGHNEYKDVLSKIRFFRNSMNRIQYRDYMKSKKKILSCFDDKIYIQDNRYDGLALDYWRLL